MGIKKHTKIALITFIYILLSIVTSMLSWHFHNSIAKFLFVLLGDVLIIIYLLIMKKLLNKMSTAIILLCSIELLAFLLEILIYPYLPTPIPYT